MLRLILLRKLTHFLLYKEMAATSTAESSATLDLMLDCLLQRCMEVQVATRKARGTAARELSSIGNAMAGARDKLTDLLLKPGEEHKDTELSQYGWCSLLKQSKSTGNGAGPVYDSKGETAPSFELPEKKAESLWEELQKAEGIVYHSKAQREIYEEQKDTLQFMMESMTAQIKSLQHELCFLRDNSSERIRTLEQRVRELERENAKLRDQSYYSSIS